MSNYHFEYRALDLLADYEPRFAYCPGIWVRSIRTSQDDRVTRSFAALVNFMVQESINDFGEKFSFEEFSAKLGDVSDRDRIAIKMLEDLGIKNHLNLSVLTYFAARRNVLDDERAWIRFSNLLEEQIDMDAC